jgi:hypothetical protein
MGLASPPPTRCGWLFWAGGWGNEPEDREPISPSLGPCSVPQWRTPGSAVCAFGLGAEGSLCGNSGDLDSQQAPAKLHFLFLDMGCRSVAQELLGLSDPRVSA